MNYRLLEEVIHLMENFEKDTPTGPYSGSVEGFKKWVYTKISLENSTIEEPSWDGKENGRSTDSTINTLLIHMNNYAKTFSKSAIENSDFSTQEEFIFLINLKAYGAMSKMALIRKNIQDKPTGIQIINRLLKQEWVIQRDSEIDKRSKIVSITEKGLMVLDVQMDKIRMATRLVTGDLTTLEKMELIKLLTKLENFHQPIYEQNLKSANLLDVVNSTYSPSKID